MNGKLIYSLVLGGFKLVSRANFHTSIIPFLNHLIRPIGDSITRMELY